MTALDIQKLQFKSQNLNLKTVGNLDLSPVNAICSQIKHNATVLELCFREGKNVALETKRMEMKSLMDNLSVLVDYVVGIETNCGSLVMEKLVTLVLDLLLMFCNENESFNMDQLLQSLESSICSSDEVAQVFESEKRFSIGKVYHLLHQISSLPPNSLILTASLIETEVAIVTDAGRELEDGNYNEKNMLKVFVLCFEKCVKQLMVEPLCTESLENAHEMLLSAQHISALIDDFVCEFCDDNDFVYILKNIKVESRFLLNCIKDTKFKALAQQQIDKYLPY